MAHLRCDFASDALELSTSMTVILPQPNESQIGVAQRVQPGDPPVLYLLHGLSDDDTAWSRQTAIERYVAPLGLAVVMPQVHRSFYLDGVHTGRYWTFVSEELPALVHRFFRVSSRREDTFVAGLSMGGYGAFRLALRQPERFAAAASLSGALDLAALRRSVDRRQLMGAVFAGGDVAGSGDDLFALLDDAEPDQLPSLYMECGTDDELYAANQEFLAAATRRGVAVTSSFSPGAHEWGYWDAAIRRVLAWLPLRSGQES